MENKKKGPEILAPAGSMESLYAAVNAGCDAVYMGGSMFGARAYADNPDRENLLYAIDYCHLHGVKLYMAVNTLLKEDEIMDSLYNYIMPYYEAGLDAAIVQDTGVIYMLHKYFPGLALHASTQMTLVSGEGAGLLKDYGITRVVPARELSLEELKQVKKDTGLETEVFVHGALCYCYSGQCLFSSLLGGRSGNRGRCAQPCRLPYQHGLQGKKQESYILSMKELCTLPYIGGLIEAGTDSFKIEGRMKSPAYTALVTSIYRKYTDIYINYGREGYNAYIQKHKEDFRHDNEMLAEVYNREGFTDGYIYRKTHGGNQKENMLASRRPKHGGVCIGKVVSTGKGKLEYKLSKDVNAGDVVEFRNHSMDTLYEYTTSTGIKSGNTVEARFSKGCNIRPGDMVYRTRNSFVMDSIKTKYLENNNKVLATACFKAAAGERASLYLEKDGINVTVYGDICQKAEKSPATDASVRKSLLQTGNTEFEFKETKIIIEDGLFLPVSMLKNMRREALAKLKSQITGSYRRSADIASFVKDIDKYNTSIQTATQPVYKASVMDLKQLGAVLCDQKISEVCIKTELLSSGDAREALTRVHLSGRKCYVVMPHIFRKKDWDYEEKMAAGGRSIYQYKWDGYLIRNLESYAFLTKVCGINPENIVTDTGLYTMNSFAMDFWKEHGVTRHTVPFELEMPCIKQIAGDFMEAVLYTHIPLMVSAQCTLSNLAGCSVNQKDRQVILKDIKGREFIVVNYCKYCYSTVYQKVPLMALSCIKDLTNAGIRGFRYDFTIEDAEETSMVLAGRYNGQTHTGHYRKGVL